eukprot:RCo028872
MSLPREGTVESWSVAEVSQRLAAEPWAGPELAAQLERHQIDGAALLELTKEDLRHDFGVQPLGQVKAILRNISRLGTRGRGCGGAPVWAEGSISCKAWSSPESGRFGRLPSASRTPGTAEDQRLFTSDGVYYNTLHPAVRGTTPDPGTFPRRFQGLTAERLNRAVSSWPSSAGGDVVGGGAGAEAPAEVAPGGSPGPDSGTELPEDSALALTQSPIKGDSPRESLVSRAETTPSQSRREFRGPPSRSGIRYGVFRALTAPAGSKRPVHLPTLASPPATDYASSSWSASGTSKSFSRMTVDSLTLRAGSLDVKAAKTRGRPRRAREERDAVQRVEAGLSPSTRNFDPGLLEAERRRKAWEQIFDAWSGDLAVGEVEGIQVEEALRLFEACGRPGEVLFPQLRQPCEGEEEVEQSAENERIELPESLTCEPFVGYLQTLTRNLTPAIFDDLVAFFNVAVGEREAKKEASRRFRLLSDLFVAWDADDSGALDKREILEVLQLFNTWANRDKDDWVVFDLSKYDLNRDEQLQPKEFIDLMTDLSRKFGKSDFDLMYYRLSRCIDTFKSDASGAPVVQAEVIESALRKLLSRSHPSQPILLYGVGLDPTKLLEKLAAEQGARMTGSVISSETSEATGLQSLSHQGIGLGWWIYFVVSNSYDVDRFLRGVAARVATAEAWRLHPRFRVVILLSLPAVHHLPALFLSRALALPLSGAGGDAEEGPSFLPPPLSSRASS